MTHKEMAMLNWKCEEAQEMLGTDAKGRDFLKVWDAAGISKQTEILTKISRQLLDLEAQKKVPHQVWQGEVEDKMDEINARLAIAFGEEPGWHGWVRLEDHTGWTLNSKIRLQVNWSCIGAVDPDKAVAFSEALVEASKYAESFHYNGFTEIFD